MESNGASLLLASAGQVDEALQLFSEMKSAGVHQNVPTLDLGESSGTGQWRFTHRREALRAVLDLACD